METRDLKIGCFRAEIYPFGVKLEGLWEIEGRPVESQGRKSIQSFSSAAARRLREAFITLHVPGFDLWAFTLTTHRAFSPPEWRAITMRFRQSVKRNGWCGIWRVELQRRKAPHAHVAFWLPPMTTHADVAELWLAATGERNDAAAREYAVHSQRIRHDDTGWAVYMGMHNGKQKEAQLGWLGKQWGIWNRDAFAERDPQCLELAPAQHAAFLRVCRRWEHSKRLAHDRFRDEKILAAIADVCPAIAASISIVPDWRPKHPPLHRGNLLRCANGAIVAAFIHAIKTGRIYHAPDSPPTG